MDDFKCFNFNFKNIRYKILNLNAFDSEELVTFVLNLKEVPQKRLFIHLNSKDSLDFGK